MTILKPICLIFLDEQPPCLSGMCSNDDADDDDDEDSISHACDCVSLGVPRNASPSIPRSARVTLIA